MRRVVDAFWFCVAAAIIGIISFVTIGACAALVPIRWLIDQSIKGKRCIECANRDEQYEIIYNRTGPFKCHRCKREYNIERT